MSPLSIAFSCIYIGTILHDILLCQSDQGYGYIWQVKANKGLCHLIKTADESQTLFDILTMGSQRGVEV